MRSILVLAGILILAGCGKKKEEGPDEGGQPAAAEGQPAAPAANQAAFEARTIFNTVCAACHGPGGHGDGSAAATLVPKPRNYTDPAWQASVKDQDIKDIILKGGQAMGKSPSMPAQPQLSQKPEVLDELVKIIRGFGGKTKP